MIPLVTSNANRFPVERAWKLVGSGTLALPPWNWTAVDRMAQVDPPSVETRKPPSLLIETNLPTPAYTTPEAGSGPDAEVNGDQAIVAKLPQWSFQMPCADCSH